MKENNGSSENNLATTIEQQVELPNIEQVELPVNIEKIETETNAKDTKSSGSSFIDSIFQFTYDFKYDLCTFTRYCLVFIIFYLVVWYFQDKTDENKSSQILTLINSFILVSIYFISYLTKNPYWTYLGYASFATINILELVLGPIYYPSKTSILTTYLHHTMYLFFIYNTLRENLPLWPLLIAELPTFILSMRYYFSINNIYIESAFGASFLTTRILFWWWFLSNMFLKYPDSNLLKYGTYFTTSVHVYWFSKWLIKYWNKWICPLFTNTGVVGS